MKVLITGGAGYIGSHAARALRKAGHDIIILDNLSTGYVHLARGYPLIQSDISNCETVRRALMGCSAVMHFAASASVAVSQFDPRSYWDNNIVRASRMLDTAIECGIRTFVFSSSCAIYGVPEKCPITETTAKSPCNTYGATKLAFEYVLASYARAYGMRYAALRYFNAAGADESGEIGEMHDPELHLIPNVLRAAAGSQRLTIYGKDYPTADGTCVRDYVHVSDLAEAHVLALEYLSAGGESQSLNLGTGTGISNLQVIRAVEGITGRTVPMDYVGRRPGDPAELYADPSQAHRVLGWTAKRSLEDIVTTAWGWMQNLQGSFPMPIIGSSQVVQGDYCK